MLNGLALAGRGALGDGAGDEEDELLGGGALEVAEVAHVGGVGEHHRVRRRRGGGRGIAGAFEDEERCDLHGDRRGSRRNPRNWGKGGGERRRRGRGKERGRGSVLFRRRDGEKR